MDKTPKRSSRRKISRNYILILSPAFSALLMTVLGILFLQIPPTFYRTVLPEKIFYWHNTYAYLLILFSGLSFIAGAYIFRRIKIPIFKGFHAFSSARVILFWSTIAVVLQLFTLYQLSSNFGIYELLSSSGDTARAIVGNINSDTKLAWLDTFSTTIVVVALWQFLQMNTSKRKIKFFLIFLIFLLTFLIAVKAVLAQIRGPILTIGVEIFCIYYYYLYKSAKINLKVLTFSILTLSFLSIMLFGYLQSKRVEQDFITSLSGGLFGYFPASYNRMAAIIDGKLFLPNAGSSYITFNWLWDFPFLGNIFNLTDIGREFGLNLPTNDLQYQIQSFNAVGYSGLIDGLIWPTIYGAVFSDIGWFTLPWFFLYGMLAEYFWRLLKSNSYIGIAAYPRILAAGVAWYSTPDIARRDIAVVILTASLLYFSDKIYSGGKT